MRLTLLAALLLAVAGPASAQLPPPAPPAPPPAQREVRCLIDLQAHPSMHFAWKFFKPGLSDAPPPHLTWRHQFKQVVYAQHLRASGVRIFGAAAMAAERAENPAQARRLILEQLDHVNRFVAAHPDDYAVARTPEEARRILATTSKMVIVHQIEGGRKLLRTPDDAAFWARQGVMLITLIHLWDDELGGSAKNVGLIGSLLNPHAFFHAKKRRGLTDRGKAAIVDLARNGIITDLSHMSPGSTDDALEVCRRHRIPPVVTHGMVKRLHDGQRGLTDAQLLEVYRLGGMFSIPVDGHVELKNPTIPVPAWVVPGTQDVFKLHAETAHGFLRDHARDLLGRDWAALGDADRTKLAIGWASDWNGWVNGSRPTPRRPGFPRGPELEVDKVGLAHPGLLPQYFQRCREAGLDFDPFERSAERFLQIWERVRALRGTGALLSAPGP